MAEAKGSESIRVIPTRLLLADFDDRQPLQPEAEERCVFVHYVIKELYDMMRKGGELGKMKEIKSKAEQESRTNLE